MNYRITIQPANIVFTTSASQTILSAALLQDIDLPFGCQGGACGACMVNKIEGEIRYPAETPPALLEEDIQAGKILCCQAFACSDIVLKVPDVGMHKQRILTLPTRVLDKIRIGHNKLALTLKLPGDQSFPDFVRGQRIDIIVGAGKTCSTRRIEHDQDHSIRLLLTADNSDSFTNYLFHDLQNGEMLRIRGPV